MAAGLGGPGRRDPPLHVFLMAVALVLAAFAGAAIGLVWQSSGFGEDAAETDAGAEEAQSENDAEPADEEAPADSDG